MVLVVKKTGQPLHLGFETVGFGMLTLEPPSLNFCLIGFLEGS